MNTIPTRVYIYPYYARRSDAFVRCNNRANIFLRILSRRYRKTTGPTTIELCSTPVSATRRFPVSNCDTFRGIHADTESHASDFTPR